MADENKKRVYNEKTAKRIQAWKDENTTRCNIRFYNATDADVIEKLKSVPNKADYIRQLIRADINKNTD